MEQLQLSTMTEEQALTEQAEQAAQIGNVWADKAAFDQMARAAGLLSKSTIVPQNYQGKPADCFLACEIASRLNISPLMVMQNLYVVKGKPAWAGQACMAMITACGLFRNARHVYTGEKGTENRGCYVVAERVSDGATVEGTEVTMQMAKAEGWTSNSKWKTMPEQMLAYRAAAFFARVHCPSALMGLQTGEEVYDVALSKQTNAQKLNGALKGA